MSKKVKCLSYFQDYWLENFSWGKRDAMDDTISYCTLYKKSFYVTALVITALHIHAKGSKHLSRSPPPTQSALNFQYVKNVQEKQSNATEEKAQSAVSSFMINEAVVDAQIMCVLRKRG